MCTCPMRSEGSWIPSRVSVYWSSTHMNKRVITAITPGPNKSDEEPTSSADSDVQSLRKKSRRRLARKGKGKKKMLEYGTERDELDQRESESEKNEDRPSKAKSSSTKNASTSANEKLRRSTCQKNPNVRFRYDACSGSA